MSTIGARGTDVVVVGAGPYGLATAAHLSKAGIDFRIFGIPMGAWRHHMPKGMFLKSAMTATSISAPAPGMSLIDYCMANGVTGIDDHNPIPIDLFVNYGLQFKKRYVEGVEQVAINQIVDMGDGFQVSLANGETFLTRNVVVASGHIHFSYIPPHCAFQPVKVARHWFRMPASIRSFPVSPAERWPLLALVNPHSKARPFFGKRAPKYTLLFAALNLFGESRRRGSIAGCCCGLSSR